LVTRGEGGRQLFKGTGFNSLIDASVVLYQPVRLRPMTGIIAERGRDSPTEAGIRASHFLRHGAIHQQFQKEDVALRCNVERRTEYVAVYI
jgi:hypothetical protein